MSTQLNTATPSAPIPKAPEGTRIGIVTAKWNSDITAALRDGAIATLRQAGLNPDTDIDCFDVPGTIELTFAASQLIEASAYNAIIVFGCVIRGDTPHFDYVCQSVTQGITALNADCDTPVIFGVLTVNDLRQALDRAGGRLGNKGSEAAIAAIEMVRFTQKI